MSPSPFSVAWCRSICLFLIVAAVGLAADLLTKHWAFQSFGMPTENNPPAVYWVWRDVFGFQTLLNPGALLGFGAGQTLILVSLSFIFIAGIICWLLFGAWRSLFLSAILGMISAGIAGNLYDRLAWHGLTDVAGQPIYAVRDWILCMIGTYPWPNFNIADSMLVCSVVLLLFQELFFHKEKHSDSKQENASYGDF